MVKKNKVSLKNKQSKLDEKLLHKALSMHQNGCFQEAESTYRLILKNNPNNSDAIHLLGVIAHQLGNNQIAINYIEKAIKINPNVSEYYNNCGTAYLALNKYDLALKCFKKALAIRFDYTEAQNNMGNTFQEMGRLGDAISCFKNAIEIKPDYATAYYNMGNTFQEMGRLGDAISCFKKAIEIKPDYATAYYNMGNVLYESGKMDDAISCYKQSLKIKPDYIDVYNNMGNVKQEMGEIGDSIELYKQALSFNTDYAEAHYNLSLIYLRASNFKQGWVEYEWRYKTKANNVYNRSFSQPQWNGSLLENKTILIHAEQGIGDTIQFIRYIPLVIEKKGKVIFQCDKKLMHIFSDLLDIIHFVGIGEKLPDFDFHAPLLSLPGIFKTNIHTIPVSVRFNQSKEKLIQLWKQKLPKTKKLKVGLCWQGNKKNTIDRSRSISLIKLKKILEIKDIDFVSLQKGEGSEQIDKYELSNLIYDFSPEMDNEKKFEDSMAIIENLDLVISVDTSIVHLSGTMSKPTWVLLSTNSDWRWMMDRQDSPWYPSIRLFRQEKLGEWESVMNKINDELEKLKKSYRDVEMKH